MIQLANVARRRCRASVLTSALAALAAPVAGDITAAGNQFWLLSSPAEGDQLGYAVATGDFDGDGYLDLAMGAPYDDLSVALVDAGTVRVIYGGSTGLSSTGQQTWHQDIVDVLGTAAANDRFGWALATGDFDHDGRDDLAVGILREVVGGHPDAGAVQVLYGQATGLSAKGNQLWSQDSPGILDAAEDTDLFGFALAADDFDGDGYVDLAIGTLYESLSSASQAGVVHVLYGSATGLSAAGNQLWYEGNLSGTAEDADFFGRALAAGDFNGDGFADLVAAAPFEDLGAIENAGVAYVIYGSAGGLVGSGAQVWHQDSPGIADSAELDDFFGHAVASGDFDGDGFADLAVGVPEEDLAGTTSVGVAHVLYGSAAGLSASGSQLWSQGSAGLLGKPEQDDRLGEAVASGDFDGDGRDELVIGVSGQEVYLARYAGAVQILRGGPSGLSAQGNRIWTQSDPGVLDQVEAGDQFGSPLASGDFDDDGAEDLAVGIPNEDDDLTVDVGAVQVLYGCPCAFADGFESGNTSAWSARVP